MPFDLCFRGDRKSDKTDRRASCPDGLGVGLSRQLSERPHDSAPRARPYRQEVDDVDPVLAVPPLRAPSYVMSSHSRLSSSHSKVTVRDGKLPGTSRSAGCGAIVGSNADGISTPTKAAHLRVYPIASRSVSGRLASRRSKVESQAELLVHHGHTTATGGLVVRLGMGGGRSGRPGRGSGRGRARRGPSGRGVCRMPAEFIVHRRLPLPAGHPGR